LEVYGSSTARLATADIAEKNNKVLSYPNPTSDLYYMDGVKDGTPISILNSTGSSVHETKIENGAIDVRHLPAGIYIIDIHDGSKQMRQKVIKK
jgi:hypothetical protein